MAQIKIVKESYVVKTEGGGSNKVPTTNVKQASDDISCEFINEQIENNFKYHNPKIDQHKKYERIRNKAKELAYLIDELCPNSREKSLAMTKLEEVSMWANASIARED